MKNSLNNERKTIILDQNLTNGISILEQAMLSNENAIYIISFDYNLDGNKIELPKGSTLQFDGGSLSNGTIVLNDSHISAPASQIFKSNLQVEGSCCNNIADVSWFGAIGDGVTDDTEALQACIEFASPFTWKGSISATKEAMGKTNAVVVGNGTYRITRTLMINPFVSIEGIKSGGFWESETGFCIVADFDNKDGFALDAAPYNTSGTRVLNLLARRQDWDDSKYSGCPGWSLHKIRIDVPQNRNLRGSINRCMSMQSHISGCSLTGGNIGIQTSTTWGGSIANNHIRARAIALANINDVTIDNQVNNYLTIITNQKPSSEDFTYPNTSWLNLGNTTCNLYNSYSHINHYNNIWEGATVGVISSGQRGIDFSNNYIEGSSYLYCYASNTCDISIKLGTTLCSNASLLFVTGAKTNTTYVDLTSADLLSVKDWGTITYVNKVDAIGWQQALGLGYNSNINFIDIGIKEKLQIYVSQQGDDKNSGYSANYPVRTLQEAILRCYPQAYNVITKTDQAIVGDTKYSYGDGSNVTTKIVAIDNIEINGGGSFDIGASYNERHSLPRGIRNIILSNINFNMGTISADYQPLIPVVGPTNINIRSSKVEGGYLTGCKWGDSGSAIISATKATLACSLVASGGASGAFAWIDTARDTSITGGNVGDSKCKKISSTLYPS